VAPRLRLLLWPAGVVVGLVAEQLAFGLDDPRRWIPDLAVGWTFLACGLVAWSRRPASRSGVLMTAIGFTWFGGNFAGVGSGVVAWLGAHAIYLHRGPLVHLLLGYPSGRVRSRLGRAAVAGGYVAALATPAWRSDVAAIVLCGLVVAVCARDYALAAGPLRRARLTSLRASAGLALVLGAGAVARLVFPSARTDDLTLLAYEGALCAVAVVFLAGLLSASWERAAVTDLVVEVGGDRSGGLRDRLARALADPTLELGYWLPDAGAFVDAGGVPVALPAGESGRSVTVFERGSEPVAVLVHDPAVLDDPGLVEAVSAAAGLEASNARLRGDIRAQVGELRESRRRILQAGDDERSRLERRLREGAERRLSALAETLHAARRATRTASTEERIADAETRLQDTAGELRGLAHGLHPRILTERGLAEALASIAGRTGARVELEVMTDPLPPPVEAAAYFVCSEAIANVAKHAPGSAVSVSVAAHGGRALIAVADDGPGGADPARGAGLRGLADRVEALGGTLRVESPPGEGTALTAEIPLANQ
jgi:signal transduction histidine kinase